MTHSHPAAMTHSHPASMTHSLSSQVPSSDSCALMCEQGQTNGLVAYFQHAPWTSRCPISFEINYSASPGARSPSCTRSAARRSPPPPPDPPAHALAHSTHTHIHTHTDTRKPTPTHPHTHAPTPPRTSTITSIIQKPHIQA
eukprot:4248991-Pleurochrysis_carterae.AAC.1